MKKMNLDGISQPHTIDIRGQRSLGFGAGEWPAMCIVGLKDHSLSILDTR